MAPNKKKSKKSKQELHEEEAAEKHSSLIAQTTKSIRKEAKVVKSFECQKIIRKIKALNENDSKSVSTSTDKDDDGDGNRNTSDAAPAPAPAAGVVDEKAQLQLEKLDEKLKAMKEFDIDSVVQVALRRLGLEQNKGKKKDKDKDKDKDSNPEENKSNRKVIESMIKQKRVSSAMQSMSEKVSDYNAWLSKREQWLANGGKGTMYHDSNITEKKQGRKRGREIDVAGHDGASGLFIESLAGNAFPEDESGNPSLMGYEGYEGYEQQQEGNAFQQQQTKKNRPGQRARKAKALAIEAKKAGQNWDNSINWREPKKRSEEEYNHNGNGQKNESASGLDRSRRIKVADVANMGKDWKEEGKAHPSWAAREAQKEKSGLGIVAFAGKKITFD
jgi:hypothetical protein